VVSTTPRPLYPRERAGTNCTGGWVGPRIGQDVCEIGGQHNAPADLPPGKSRYQLYRRLGGPQGRSGRVRKISPPTGIRSPGPSNP
jgi:hypothetical protein